MRVAKYRQSACFATCDSGDQELRLAQYIAKRKWIWNIESTAVIPTDHHSLFWDTKHKALMGNGETTDIAEHSTYVIYNCDRLGHAARRVNVRTAYYNLQENFNFRPTSSLQ